MCITSSYPHVAAFQIPSLTGLESIVSHWQQFNGSTPKCLILLLIRNMDARLPDPEHAPDQNSPEKCLRYPGYLVVGGRGEAIHERRFEHSTSQHRYLYFFPRDTMKPNVDICDSSSHASVVEHWTLSKPCANIRF